MRSILITALLLAGSASAQTTHDVFADGFDFTPKDLVIDAGDTVRWTWGAGLHDVLSGQGGIHDGIFASGSPVFMPGHTFQVTFDAAFLAANPVPGDVYGYFCSIHVSMGMFGSITVDTGPTVTPIGCNAPAGSLTQVSGQPSTGTTWTVGVTNPIPGAQTPGSSFAFLGVSSVAAPGACGFALPGWHMDPLAPAGELLIGVAPPNPVVQAGPKVWTGTPAAFGLPIPANPALVGKTVYVQGLIVDPIGSNTFGLSGGFEVVLD